MSAGKIKYRIGRGGSESPPTGWVVGGYGGDDLVESHNFATEPEARAAQVRLTAQQEKAIITLGHVDQFAKV
jgi:hypothetical protein